MSQGFLGSPSSKTISNEPRNFQAQSNPWMVSWQCINPATTLQLQSCSGCGGARLSRRGHIGIGGGVNGMFKLGIMEFEFLHLFCKIVNSGGGRGFNNWGSWHNKRFTLEMQHITVIVRQRGVLRGAIEIKVNVAVLSI
jgi:hypothetical protein